MDIRQQQLSIELSAYNDSYKRQSRRNTKAHSKQTTGETKAGRYFLTNFYHAMIKPMQSFMDDTKKRGKYVNVRMALTETGISAEVLCHLTSKAIINVIGLSDKPVRRVSLYLAIGNIIHDQWRMEKFSSLKERRNLLRKIIKDCESRGYSRAKKKSTIRNYFDAEMVTWQGWHQKDKILIGKACLEIFQQATSLLDTKKSGQFYEAGKVLVRQFDKVIEHQAKSFLLYPIMVTKPVDWSEDNLFRGGYISDKIAPYPIIKRAGKKDIDRILAMDWEIPFKAINALQSTAYRINAEMVEVLSWAFRELDKDVGKMPAFSDKVFPNFPHDYYTNDKSKRDHNYKCYKVIEANQVSRPKRLATAMAIQTAKEYQKYDAIYFPHSYDNRGRVYAIPGFVNPQGPEYIRALLEFSEGKAITKQSELDWLCIGIANSWGEDKIALNLRVKWCEDNSDMLLEIASDWTNDLRWTHASDPFSFLRGCLEWKKFREKGFGFVSHYICSVDATTSGIMHYAAMTRDEELGRLVNLTPNASRQDLYGEVAGDVVRHLQGSPVSTFVMKGSAYHVSPNVWLRFGIDRSMTKKQVMTSVYSATFHSALAYTREAVAAKLEKGFPSTWEHADEKVHSASTMLLAQSIWQATNKRLGKAGEAMAYLKNLAMTYGRWLNEHGKSDSLSWKLPDNFEVSYLHKKQKKKRIDTWIDGKTPVQLIIYEDDIEVDCRKLGQTFPPNFVHSLDSCHLRLTIRNALAKGIYWFSVVHDSFGSHCAAMPDFVMIIKETFVKMYRSDVLGNLATQYNYLKLNKKMPDRGKLDLAGMISNEFAFS